MRASLDEIPSTAAATLADYGQFASGLAALAAATGEAAYAERARDLVLACGGPDGELRTPGGGDPVLAAQGIGTADAASDGDEPSGAAAVAGAATALWLFGAGEEFRVMAERVVSEHASAALVQPLAYGALLRVAAELAQPPRQLVVVGGDPAAPLVAAARRMPADVLAIVTPRTVFAVGGGGFQPVRGERAAERRGDGV